jgi:hypothetical protein
MPTPLNWQHANRKVEPHAHTAHQQ